MKEVLVTLIKWVELTQSTEYVLLPTDDVVVTAPIAKSSFHCNRIDRMHHNALLLHPLDPESSGPRGNIYGSGMRLPGGHTHA